jgi:TRAP-type uncharacterized transport system substrate-binding protein
MREFIKAYWLFIAIGLLGLLVASRFVEPAPPKTLKFAAGAEGGAYFAYASRYQRLLAEQGVEVTIIRTAGSIENLRLVQEGDADVGLIQGGIANAVRDDKLRSAGAMFLEPAWLFVRRDIGASDFGDLRTSRIAIGQTGSGTRALALGLQAEWDGNWSSSSQLEMSGSAAGTALLAGEIDAAFFVASIDAPYLQPLLVHPDLAVLPFPRAEALARRSPALAPTVLLRGVLDIGADIPAQDIPLIAPAAQLVFEAQTHPAIQSLLLEAASDIHSDGSLLASAATFPESRLTDLPTTREVRRFYRRGPSTLRRWFSFGTANFLERSWVLLIPLVTLMIPLVRVAPPIYRWQVRRRIYVWYSDLRELETRGRQAATVEERRAVMTQLNKLQEDAGAIDVPLSYTDDLYRLRGHIDFVDHLLKDLEADASTQKARSKPHGIS